MTVWVEISIDYVSQEGRKLAHIDSFKKSAELMSVRHSGALRSVLTG